MFFSYLILLLCVIAYCSQDDQWLRCKPKPGCSIAQCDPRPPGRWSDDDNLDNDYTLLCQQSKVSSSATAVTELVNKFDEIQIDLVKIKGRLERSEKVEFEMNFDITLLEKKNAETESGLRNEMDKLKKKIEENKTQLNGTMKQITSLEKTNGEMRNEIVNVKKEAKEDKGKLNGAMKQIAFLEKNEVEMKRKINRLEIEANRSKRKMNDAMIQIDFLKKKNEKSEKDAEESKGQTEDLIKRIVSLENENVGKRENGRTSEKETRPVTKNKNNTTTVPCSVIYENKCFIAVFGHKFNYDGGVIVCKSLGGHLANIYSQTHMDDVMKYIRLSRRRDRSVMTGFRLGMKYNQKANKLTLRDGTDAPANLKWYPSFPRTVKGRGAGHANHTNVILFVGSDQLPFFRYLANDVPSKAYNFLCENE